MARFNSRPDRGRAGIPSLLVFASKAVEARPERGMHTAIVSTAGINTPAASLYPSAGFTLLSRDPYYPRPV